MAVCESGANARRSLLQTLLVGVECCEVMGLLADLVLQYPGSPRLGSVDPGLNPQPFQGWYVAVREGEAERRGIKMIPLLPDVRRDG